MLRFVSFFALLAIPFLAFSQQAKMMQVPGRNSYTSINKNGISVLPSGRFVKPVGEVFSITNDPFGLAVSPTGRLVVAIHNGVITILDNSKNTITRIPDYEKKIPSPFLNGSLVGVAFGKSDSTLYLSGGDCGSVVLYNPVLLQFVDSISLNQPVGDDRFNDSFTSDLVYVKATDELLVLDIANYRVVRVNCKSRSITASIKTGRLPFGLAVSPDGRYTLVANVGMYSYPLIEGMNSKNYDSLMISSHPYGHNTPESKTGTIINGRTIPGVGDPRSEEAMSVYVIDLQTNQVVHRIPTGHRVGDWIDGKEVIGGSSPNSIVIGEQMAYITNATNDNISVLDYRSGKIEREIQLKIDNNLDKLRGYLPFGIEISPDEAHLYVALLGFNSVATIDTKNGDVLGLIPAGWGPTRVRLSRDAKNLFITSCRGFGAGPNGGREFVPPIQGTYIGDIQLATLQRVPIPDSSSLRKMHNDVISYTYREENQKPAFLPAFPGEKNTPIKHIVFITKENRTYDEMFGQLRGGNGDSSLARFGNKVNLITLSDTIKGVSISPNHTKIAQNFSYSDNFYCDSDASIHGHHWMMGVIPNEWVEANSNTSKTALLFSSAPGRRYPGSTGSMDPEDFSEIGGLWEALERSNVSFYNFGEANETAHVREEWFDTATGAAHGVMVPMQKALFRNTSKNYAGYNTNIPDQFRVEQFQDEFKKLWGPNKGKLPSLITIQLPNDHTANPRPDDGYPYRHSFVADNDLALGRILQFLSQTSYWKEMLVIITEDDPQGGVDHIDAHRSILMMAGPYVKKGHVSHTHANFGSILKTIYLLLGVPFVNHYDMTASVLDDYFTHTPDFSKYTFIVPDLRVFDPVKSMKKYKRNIDWRTILPGTPMDEVGEIKLNHYKN
ncbi:MAG: bifunctional YncE family protein/alkaline phosphatase family protein [Bacteroidota bacterium]